MGDPPDLRSPGAVTVPTSRTCSLRRSSPRTLTSVRSAARHRIRATCQLAQEVLCCICNLGGTTRGGNMARRRSVLFIVVAVGAVVGALGVLSASAKPPAEADATSVTQWNLTAASTLAGLPGPAGGAPPATQISMGMVQGAVYDAVNAITPKHDRPYLLTRRFGNTASDEAAVATAAYLVLKNIVETVPPSITFPTRGDVLASLETQYNASKNAIPDSPSKDKGIEAGTAAAQAMIDARQGDGRFGPSQFVPNANPGYWDPVAPNGTTVPDPTPWVGGVEPFLMQSSSQFRSPDPYATQRGPMHSRAPPTPRTSTRSRRSAATARCDALDP